MSLSELTFMGHVLSCCRVGAESSGRHKRTRISLRSKVILGSGKLQCKVYPRSNHAHRAAAKVDKKRVSSSNGDHQVAVVFQNLKDKLRGTSNCMGLWIFSQLPVQIKFHLVTDHKPLEFLYSKKSRTPPALNAVYCVSKLLITLLDTSLVVRT